MQSLRYSYELRVNRVPIWQKWKLRHKVLNHLEQSEQAKRAFFFSFFCHMGSLACLSSRSLFVHPPCSCYHVGLVILGGGGPAHARTCVYAHVCKHLKNRERDTTFASYKANHSKCDEGKHKDPSFRGLEEASQVWTVLSSLPRVWSVD